jgi:hypothetical protein
MIDPNVEAERFCEQRNATIERWISKQQARPFTADSDVNVVRDPSGEYVSVSYWWGPNLQQRIHKVGRTLHGAVQQCQEAEA